MKFIDFSFENSKESKILGGTPANIRDFPYQVKNYTTFISTWFLLLPKVNNINNNYSYCIFMPPKIIII